MFYDAFTFTPLMAAEDLGFVPKGEGGPFFAETKTGPNGEVIYKSGPGGDFPMNTNGGGLSYCHTGMYGMFAIIESVRQLRGECGDRQVPGRERQHGSRAWWDVRVGGDADPVECVAL